MKARPEDALQESLVDFIRLVAPQCLVAAVPNETGWLSGQQRGRLQRLGRTAGIFDLLLMIPGGKVAFIEVKPRGRTLSKAQIAIRDRMIALGTPHVIARSIDDVRAALAQWGVSSREAA